MRVETTSRMHVEDDIAARYRHTTPYYDLVILTSPARIESLAIDPSGRSRHLGVINNFGRLGSTVFASYGSFSDVEPNAVVAGRPAHVVSTAEELRLEGLPVGPHGLYATWSFIFDEKTFDLVLTWMVNQPQADLWEAGWKLDGVARHVGTVADAVQPGLMWWEDDPRYAHTLVTTLVPGSADRMDGVGAEQPPDRPTSSGIWDSLAVDGGTDLQPGIFQGGRWRIGASGRPHDAAYARALCAEAAGGPVARPSSTQESHIGSQLSTAIAFAARLEPPEACRDRVRRGPDGSWLLTNGRILAAFAPTEDVWLCWLYVATGTGWQLTATAAPSARFTLIEDGGNGCLVVRGELLGAHGSAESTTAQEWELRDGAFRINAVDTPLEGYREHPMHNYLAYPGELSKHDVDRYDVLASPSLRPQADLIVGQRALWSPAVCVQHKSSSVALIPNLLEHRMPGSHGSMPTNKYLGLALDLDVANQLMDGPVLSFGWRSVEGVYGYYFRDRRTTPGRPLKLSYDIVVRSGAPPRSVISDVQRRLWEDVGRRYFTQSRLPQTQSADAAFDEAWSYWHDHYDACEIGGTLVGAVRVDRVLEPGINFMSWFNALRTSYGLFTHGRDRDDANLMSKARSTLELLLAAPCENGAFPTIADIGDHGVEWQASHRNFLNQMPWGPTSYATFDMGWAAYWLLRWHQDLEPAPRAVEFARAYGDFVLSVQLPNGAVPSWIKSGNLDVDPHLRESAQAAGSVMLLGELARVAGDQRYLAGAQRAGEYVGRNHLDSQRWDDFEPYYSNTLKSEGSADPFSGQHTQNTLSMHFAALGFLTLYQLTGEGQWLSDGQRAVDTLLQYQYVTPGLALSLNCFGGFAVQNTDNEALDARQSQFGVTLLDYARATGRKDYAERGIAALRAGFATMASPTAEIINPKYFDAHPTGMGPENYAHATFDTPAEFSMFDWGQGSAVAGFAEARNRFGDVWVDARHEMAHGIDDVHVDAFRLEADKLSLELSSPSSGHVVRLKVDGLDVGTLRLAVNDEPVQTYSRPELEAGVCVPTRQQLRIAHNPTRVGPPVAGAPLRITARITHDEPIVRAALRYRGADETWRAVALTVNGDESWTGTIPTAALRAGDTIHYYIVATTSRQTRTAPEVDPADVPFSLPVAACLPD